MVTVPEFETYRDKNAAAMRELLIGTGTRPVLFLGSGMTRRYLGAPNWFDLLKAVAEVAGITTDEYNFLSQKANNNPAELGTLLVDPIHTWAWSAGKNMFPQTYFSPATDKSIFLKHIAAEHLKSFGPLPDNHPFTDEIELAKKTAPHAIITTNFDTMIEQLFPDFELVIGEQVIPMSMNILGELYKIHGTVDDPATLVLTRADYDRFTKKRCYISAKMMTYFAEYPVFIMGYGLGDPNVNAIISDLGEAMKDKGGLLENVYYVEWVPDISALTHLKEEHVVPVEPGLPPLRVRTIVTSDFDWILSELGDATSPLAVNTKVLRTLASRVIELVRADVPRNAVELDYARIEGLTDNAKELAQVLGIGNVGGPNLAHPYTLTQVAEQLGYKYWNYANTLLTKASQKSATISKPPTISLT